MNIRSRTEKEGGTALSIRFCRLIGFASLLALLSFGCAGSNRSRGDLGQGGDEWGSQPPTFLSGPANVLLTNGSGFSARLLAEIPAAGGQKETRTLAGQLLGQGGKLIFSPSDAGIFFIWDVKENAGYVLNEALQGYAPVSANSKVLTIAGDPGRAGPISETVQGHACKREDMLLASSEGTAAQFTVWRAGDLSGLTLRIKSVSGRTRFTLNLSDVRLETLPASIFLPPDGFTRYADTEMMRAELISRRATLKKNRTKVVPDEAPGVERSRRASPMVQ